MNYSKFKYKWGVYVKLFVERYNFIIGWISLGYENLVVRLINFGSIFDCREIFKYIKIISF